jgi:hypothetical protein
MESLQLCIKGLDKGDKRGSRRLHADVRRWMRTHLSPAGFVIGDADRTVRYVAPLVELRSTLAAEWSERDSGTLAKVLQSACQLMGTGRSLLGEATLDESCQRRLRRLVRDKVANPWSSLLLQLAKGVKAERKLRKSAESGWECDEARIGILRPRWTDRGAHAAVDWRTRDFRIDARLDGRDVFRGSWIASIDVDGKSIQPTSDWSNVGWNVDSLGQYLEFQQEWSNGASIERVLFAPRSESMLILLDAVKSPGASRLEYRWGLPASTLEAVEAPTGTRSMVLSNGTAVFRALPVSLSADVREPSSGSVRLHQGRLDYQMMQPGGALVTALVVTGDHPPADERRPWRRLTVTSDQKVMTPAEASAFRLMLGDRQIVLYRSLVGTRRCSFLGHQTFYETYVGEIDASGKHEEWLAVDAHPDVPFDVFGAAPPAHHINSR